MPWRQKPAPHLEYWTDPVNLNAGFKTVVVFCLGPAKPVSYYARCQHNGRLKLADLPPWDWSDISAHLRCTACGTVGYVDTRVDWSEVINFNKSVG
jgi:hypothetical protein